VAIYYLNVKSFGRNAGKRGSRATSGAAYRAGERIRDERTGAVYDHTGRNDVQHKEIVLPSRYSSLGLEINWARDRSTLWNAAERAEARKNARVAREYTVALPHELSHTQRVGLVQNFARELAERYKNAVDLVIHEPRSDPRNYHAHLLTTTREVTEKGLGPKTTLELSGSERHRRGLGRAIDELISIRERWATLANDALREAGLEARISHLSYEAQGINRIPGVHVPLPAYRAEHEGKRSEIAERMRARHEQKWKRAIEKKASLEADSAASLPALRPVRETLEQIQEQARRKWLVVRETIAGRSQSPARERGHEQQRAARDQSLAPSRPDDGLGM
jgi:ATP-dependent exoDNAse (exonuclease V) alpha subunit